MADINKPPAPVAVSWNGGGNARQQGHRRGGFSHAAGAYASAPLAEPHDTLSIQSIPPHELTDSVRRTMEDLMGEIDRLRWALEHSEGRQAYLEGLADRDAVLPILNRRAFERELATLIRQTEQDPGAPPPVLAAFYLANFEGLHSLFGLDAAEMALRHVAETLLSHVRQSDVVGVLGGAGIGVVLTLSSESAIRTKALHLKEAVLAWPPRYQEAPLPLTLQWAVQGLRGVTSVAAALSQVDERLRSGADEQGE